MTNEYLLTFVRFFAEIDNFFSMGMKKKLKESGLDDINHSSKFLQYPVPVDGYLSRYTRDVYGYPSDTTIKIWSITIYVSSNEIYILVSLDQKDDEGEDSEDLYSGRFLNLDGASEALPSIFRAIEKSVNLS